LALCAPLLIGGCFSPIVKNPTSVGAPGTTVAYPTAEYRITSGDQLDVKFFYNPELNESVVVRPDGQISLQLVHEITASGKTPGELSKELSEKYASELLNPEVTVLVKSFSTFKVFIDGEIALPGAIDSLSPLSVMQAIAYAGGLKPTARTKEVIVLRRGAGNKPMAIPIDLEHVYDGTDMRQDIQLAPYDIVFVPRSTIANVDKWMVDYVTNAIFVIPTEFFLMYSIVK
jgi:protein involved in polysaccharide export with SLBB domain